MIRARLRLAHEHDTTAKNECDEPGESLAGTAGESDWQCKC